jgi:hypothetical protein
VLVPTRSLATSRLERARIDAIDGSNAGLAVRDCPTGNNPEKIVCNGVVLQIKVDDLALKARLKEFNIGDQIRLSISDKNVLEDIRGLWSIDDIDSGCRILILIARAWKPSDIRNVSLLERVFASMQSAEGFLERVKAAQDKIGPEGLKEVIGTLGIKSIEKINNLDMLQRLVVALEEKIETI